MLRNIHNKAASRTDDSQDRIGCDVRLYFSHKSRIFSHISEKKAISTPVRRRNVTGRRDSFSNVSMTDLSFILIIRENNHIMNI
ncbi:hypothetical protein QUF90_04335 [Desulfococcaceae bacterium HSG9]|nr:hypothetical protein [Desulfococcaceae bacterium HSG9]